MKGEKAIDWREIFPQLPLDKDNKFKEGSWKEWVKGIFFNLVFSLEKEDNECVGGELVVMCEEMLFMEANVCKKKSMEGSYV
jgi:hypothetical protein